MQYQITSDNIEISASMEELAREKFARIEHKLSDIPEGSKSARIVLNSAPEGRFLVKVRLMANGREYFSNETDYTLESALIKTIEELFNMLEKEKTKEVKMRREEEALDPSKMLTQE